jgi:hypothetical protein
MIRYQQEKYQQINDKLLMYDFICDMDLEKEYNEYRIEKVGE